MYPKHVPCFRGPKMHCGPCVIFVEREYGVRGFRQSLKTYHPANTFDASIFNACGDVIIDFLDPVPRAPCIPSPNANTPRLITLFYFGTNFFVQ